MPTTGTTMLPTRAGDAHHRVIELITAERVRAPLLASTAARY